MGLGGISVWQLAIIAVIVIVIFGTKRLRNLGEDLGGGIKGLRDGFGDGGLSEVANDVASIKKDLDEAAQSFNRKLDAAQRQAVLPVSSESDPESTEHSSSSHTPSRESSSYHF